MQPELISHIEDAGDFNSIDLMFRHHICPSHLADTSRRVQGSGGKGNFKIIYINIASEKVEKGTFDLHKID